MLGFVLYWALVIVLDSRGILKKYDVSAVGPLLMLRTRRGKKLLDRLAAPRWRRFWRVYGNIGVAVAVFFMAVTLFFLVFLVYQLAKSPPSPSQAPNPRNALAIPGVSDFLPLSMAPEIIAGLFLGIVVHEGGHGVMSRVADIGVESMGLVNFAFLPVGAFVEPDEDEVEGASPGSRTRMFAAGIMNNFVLTALVFVLLAVGMMWVQPVDGVGVQSAGGLAGDAGVVEGEVIQAVDGESVQGIGDYVNATLNASGTMTLRVYSEGETRNVSVELPEGVRVSGVEELTPADRYFRRGDVITSVNGSSVRNASALNALLDGREPGDSVRVGYMRNGEQRKQVVELAEGPDGGAYLGVRLFSPIALIGISPYDIQTPYSLLSSFHPVDWLLAIFLPVGGFTSQFFGFDGSVTGFYELRGAAALFGGAYWVFLNVLYWTGWINLNVAIFNCIPAVPLDGGHIFREITRKAVGNVAPEETVDRVTNLVTGGMAVLMFGSIVFVFVAPYLLG